MNIIIQQQKISVGQMDIVAVSSASNFQVGDNDQIILYSASDEAPDYIQLGPFLPRAQRHSYQTSVK